MDEKDQFMLFTKKTQRFKKMKYSESQRLEIEISKYHTNGNHKGNDVTTVISNKQTFKTKN